MSRQPYVKIITPTPGIAGTDFVAVDQKATLRHAALRAVRTSAGSDEVSMRMKGGSDTATLNPDDHTATVELLGVDLAQIEVSVPADMELHVIGSPY